MRLQQYIINEDKHTDYLETAATLGINPSSEFKKACEEWLTEPKNYTPSQMMDLIKGEFSKSFDWNTSGISAILEINVNTDPVDPKELDKLSEVISLAVGMMSFVSDVVKINNPYFIHSQIKKYYDVEKKVMGEIKGSKANTADCIITSVPPDKLFSLMTQTKPIGSDKGYVEVEGEMYYQVSLKKARGAAQLGKISSFLSKNLGVSVSATKASEKMGSIIECNESINMFITEGLWSKMTNIATSVWGKVSDFIKGTTSKLISLAKKVLSRGITSSDLNDIAKVVGYHGPITEAMVDEFNNGVRMLLEANKSEPRASLYDENGRMYSGDGKSLLDVKTQKLVEGIVNNPNAALNLINKEISILLKDSIDSGGAVVCSANTLNNISKEYPDEQIPSAAFALAANYASAKTFSGLIENSHNIVNDIKRIITEMFFGGTKLPLWKVYGATKKADKSYEFLGTIETFMDNMDIPEIEVLGIGIKPSDSGLYYNIKVVMLEEVTEKGKNYIVVRAGTNSSSGFTANFEGSGIQKLPLDKNVSAILTTN